jgi:hypothetical protein
MVISVSDNEKVQSAAVSFLTTNGNHPVAHPECLVLQRSDNELVVLPAGSFKFVDISDDSEGCDVIIHNSWILSTCAVVEFEVSSKVVGYMTLLLLQSSKDWVVISVVETNKTPSTPVTSTDFLGPLKICWDDYCSANRACDGSAMAQVFHPDVCRLTYSSHGNDDDAVVVKSSAEFCRMVTGRYDTEPMHIPYAAYRNDPAAAAGDTMQGVSMISPTLALVRLKVGHPPCLWSDVLVCAKVLDRWWIVAKSSSSEPLLIGPTAE